MFKRACVMSGLLFLPAFGALASINDLVISEILPNPIGDENENEFIEIYNAGSEEIDLTGLFLDDADEGSKPFAIPSGIKIAAGTYLTFYSKDTGLGLTNAGERARILNADQTLLTEVSYGVAEENLSYARQEDGIYAWTTPPTPENIFIMPSPTPTPIPTDSPTPQSSVSPSPSPTATPAPAPDYSAAKKLVINEALPDPDGNDGQNEFIEIYNPGWSDADLSGFYIDDAEGGSVPHKIAEGTVVEANGYLVFYSRDSKLALNNGGDSARLLYPDKTFLCGMTFDKSPHEERSYARKSDASYAWTAEPTPGEENEFADPEEEDEEEESSPEATVKPKATPTPQPTKKPKASATPKGSVVASDSKTTQNFTTRKVNGSVLGVSQKAKEMAIRDLPAEKIATLVTVKGTVSQVPGGFDRRLMYLAGSGIGVFLSSGDFPELVLGDSVTVTGVLVKPGKELFISVGAKENIIKESSGAPSMPHAIELKDVDDGKIGWLIKTSGKLVNGERGAFRLEGGGKTVDILFAVSNDFKAGEDVEVIGIVSADGEDLRILTTEIAKAGKADEKTGRINVLAVLGRWKTGVSALFFACALVLAILMYYPWAQQKLRPLTRTS